jgi:signal peptidase I
MSEQESQTEPNTDSTNDELRKLQKSIRSKHFWINSADESISIGQPLAWAVAIFALIPAVLSMFLGYSFAPIQSGSMTGTANIGDLVVLQPTDGARLTEGQIASFKSGTGTFIHRVVAVNDDGTYTTKGDANPGNDLWKSSDAEVTGVKAHIIGQPLASAIVPLTFTQSWTDSWNEAFGDRNISALLLLIRVAPPGLLILAASVVLLWWVFPAVFGRYESRQRIKDELALETMKLSVTKHDDSLTELEPVVEELKQEHETVKAEKAESQAMAAAAEDGYWNTITGLDPETYWNDDEDEKPATITIPDPFAAVKAQRDSASSAALGRRLSVFHAPNESTHTEYVPKHRLSASAFDLTNA